MTEAARRKYRSWIRRNLSDGWIQVGWHVQCAQCPAEVLGGVSMCPCWQKFGAWWRRLSDFLYSSKMSGSFPWATSHGRHDGSPPPSHQSLILLPNILTVFPVLSKIHATLGTSAPEFMWQWLSNHFHSVINLWKMGVTGHVKGPLHSLHFAITTI